MSGALDLVLTITAADAGSAVIDRFTKYLVKTKGASKELQDQLDRMNHSITRGVKALALSRYGWEKLKPGISAASDLQEAMNQVQRNTAGSVSSALQLAQVLGTVRRTAIAISAAPGSTQSASDVVGIENSLLKAGLPISDVIGQKGAAFAASALSTLSNLPSDVTGDSLANIGNQFAFKGPQYTDAADWLARVDDATATSIPKLLNGLTLAGASAAALNIPFKDTVTSLGQLSPLGDRAGASLDGFLRGLKTQQWAFGPNGFIGLPNAIAELQKRLEKLPTQQAKLVALQKAFGDEGGRAANTFITSANSFEDIEAAATRTLSLTQKLEISSKSFKNSATGAANALKTAAATTLSPALVPLTGITNAVKDSANNVAQYMDDHQGAATATTTLAGGALAGTAAYGIWKILSGLGAGAKALKMTGGVGGLLGGVAKGAAIQEVTGGRVQPVYVTNWPGTAPGNVANTVAGGSSTGTAAGTGAAAGVATRAGLLPWLLAGATTAAVAKSAWGYLENKWALAGALTGHGNAKSLSMLDELAGSPGITVGDRARDLMGGMRGSFKPADIGGVIRIELDDKGRLQVRDIRKTGNAGVDFSVGSGQFFYGMAAP